MNGSPEMNGSSEMNASPAHSTSAGNASAGTASAHTALRVDDLSAGYRGDLVVHNVSLTIRANEIGALVGPNGCGKSTLLKAISGVMTPASGKVILGDDPGQDLTGLPPQQLAGHGLGYVPQLANTFPSLTVLENLRVGVPRRAWRQIRERQAEMFELFPDLYASRKRLARQLSGGQREMLALALALIRKPSIILVDEPSAGLSPKFKDLIWDHLVSLRASGVALLVVEQDVSGIMQIADVAHLMVQGSIAMTGTGQELLEDQEMAARYLGVDAVIAEAD
jgi:branched-chain amino acid transport system ATP-binding protein